MAAASPIPKALQPGALAQVAQAHYRALCGRWIDVPEWPAEAGGPTRIYFDPLTIAERDRVRRDALGNDDTDTGSLDYLVRVIIAKAKDADGKPLFAAVDRHILRHEADERVVRRVAEALLGAEDPEAVDLLRAMQDESGFAVLALYDIAATLAMPVAELRERVGEQELQGWIAWARLRGRI